MIQNVAFIGLGLLGGSLAKRIRQKHPGLKLYANTHSAQTMALALSAGVVDVTGDLETVVREADLIFIATPLEFITKSIVQTYKKSKPEAIIVDLGSTKTDICKAMQGYADKFIGGHPMAGTEKTGYTNSFPEMLDNAMFVLTPYKKTPKKKLEILRNFIQDLDMRTTMMLPEVHDTAVAAISHVPYFTAAALVGLADTSEKKALAATGFQSSTRVAGSDADWGVGVAMTNKKAVLKELQHLQKELMLIKKLIATDNTKKLKLMLEKRRQHRLGMYPQ